MEIVDLKFCLKALEKENRQNGTTYKKIVQEIIELYDMEENFEAVKFWKNRLLY